jgi:hypothetical protein
MAGNIDAAQPDCPNIADMTLEAVQRELAAYRPGTASEVVELGEWLARRMQLWRRLDALTSLPATAANR